jgi:hypothetical protein
MRLQRRKASHDKAERIYEVIPTDAGWRLLRKRGGYRADFGSRSAAVERGMEICRQLAPARLRVRDPRGEVTEEVLFAGTSSLIPEQTVAP